MRFTIAFGLLEPRLLRALAFLGVPWHSLALPRGAGELPGALWRSLPPTGCSSGVPWRFLTFPGASFGVLWRSLAPLQSSFVHSDGAFPPTDPHSEAFRFLPVLGLS